MPPAAPGPGAGILTTPRTSRPRLRVFGLTATYAELMAVKGSRKARAARRRKRRMDRVEHDLSEEQWTALKAAWGGCAYCGGADRLLQRDCLLALSRGGRYTLDNIVPACRACNTSKCNAEVTGWLRRKRLDERAFLLRHHEISTALALRFRTEPAAPSQLGRSQPGVIGLQAARRRGSVDLSTAAVPPERGGEQSKHAEGSKRHRMVHE